LTDTIPQPSPDGIPPQIRDWMISCARAMEAGKGDHQKWYCPCGEHMAVVVEAQIVSPGVVRDTVRKLACLPEGWLR
jgi:hypothetical protein